MSVNTKITLRVKSGPGEIIGITELESINGFVDFSGIQFSDPGEYIISMIPSNKEEVEEGEFTVNILPEEEVIPQDRPIEEKEPITGNRPIIAQITQPSIKLDPMEFETSSNSTDNAEISSSLGYTPFVWYNGTQIKVSDIIRLDLYYDDISPNCQLTIRDTLGLLSSNDTMPLNDTKFEVFFNSGSDILKSIHLKFKLELNQKNKNGTIIITGILDIKDFYKIGYKSYTGTSFEVLKNISTELELGFNSNINSTNDSMKWRRSGTRIPDFMRKIVNHSYISDDSFLVGYIDYYWSFNYIDVEKEWKRDISNDVGLNTQGISSVGGEGDVSPLYLTNDKSENTSAFYFTNFRLNNSSTFQTTKKGIFSVSKVYDRLKKQFLKFNIDSVTSDGDDKVILKGAPGDSTELETNFTTNYGGKIDTDNVHENYLYAIEQNSRNFENLVNISAEIDLPQPNFNLYKYQKVKIKVINERQTISDQRLVDERLSGDWMILNISYSWSGGSLSQKLVIVRKELGKTKKEIENQEVKNDKSVDNSEINENPSTIEDVQTPPNSIYQASQKLTAMNNNGEMFEITIVDLLSNGNEVVATVKKIN
jgi:hypothetical protein